MNFIGGLICIGLIIWGVSGLVGAQNTFNAWADDCLDAEGIVSKTEFGLFSGRYECFVDGKKVTLPGWEKY